MAVGRGRLTVRSPRPDDAAAMEGWLAPALAGASGDSEKAHRAADALKSRLSAADRAVRVIDVSGDPAGLIATEASGDALRLAVVMRPDARGRGLAAEALAAIERRSGPGVRRFLGAVPSGDGRALYFWLRLGYRPAVIELNGRRRVWMERIAGGAR